MDPHGPDVFTEPLSDLRHPEASAIYQRETERFAKLRAERSPRDAAAGRAALRPIVSAAVPRLEALRDVRAAAEAESAGLSEVSARMSFRAKETVEWLWKHQARCSRSLYRTLDELRKVRRDFDDDLPASPGPMPDVLGPSSGSESVEGSDLPATAAEPTAVEPTGDLDARDVTNESGSCRLTRGNAVGAGLVPHCDEHLFSNNGPPNGGDPTVISSVFVGVPPSGGPGAIDRPPEGGTPTSVSLGITTLQDVHRSELITPPECPTPSLPQHALGAGLMTPPECPTVGLPQSFNHPIPELSYEAIAPPEPFSVTTDHVQGTTAPEPRGQRRRADQNVIVLALLVLLFTTVVAAAFGTWVPARATEPRAVPDQSLWPEGHGDHNVTNEPNSGGGPAIIVAGFRRDVPGTTGTDRGPLRRHSMVPLIPPRPPPPGER